MASATEALIRRHVESGTVPGAVALLGRTDESEPEIVAVGFAALGGDQLRDDAIMRIQSMTKPITAVAALRLVERGRVGLDDSLEPWLPELAGRRVLTSPSAALDSTTPAPRPITLRHLLLNASGYGMITADSPLQRAMAENGTEAGPEPVSLGAQEWLERLAELPLAFPPGEGWRYHHSYGVLGILLARLTDRPLGEHLADDLFGPLAMTDTALWVPEQESHRLPAAYRHTDDDLVEVEPAAGGFYAGPPPFDVSHGELVSTARDYFRFVRALFGAELVDDQPLIATEHRQQMTGDQVPAANKTPESFFPGFWDGMGWGFGVAVHTEGPRTGRCGWSGGQGTDFFADPDGTVGILLTQVELGERVGALVDEFQSLSAPAG